MKNLTIDGLDTVTLRRRGHFKCRRVVVRECQKIPLRSEKGVMAIVTLLCTHESPGDAIIDAKKFRSGLHVARILLPESHRDVRVRIANTTSKPQVIPLDACLG